MRVGTRYITGIKYGALYRGKTQNIFSMNEPNYLHSYFLLYLSYSYPQHAMHTFFIYPTFIKYPQYTGPCARF